MKKMKPLELKVLLDYNKSKPTLKICVVTNLLIGL